MNGSDRNFRFEEVVLPHLDAAYNLARWLTGNEHDAEDVVQEACVRAFRFIDHCRGENARAWLLSIVRNTCFTWLKRNRPNALHIPLDDIETEIEDAAAPPGLAALQKCEAETVRKALDELPAEFREILVLREFEGLSYKEIADIIEAPVGTVMSRLARARQRLQQALLKSQSTGDLP
jgi:RNA polymerase sigma-70 factor (ECF subfamily)